MTTTDTTPSATRTAVEATAIFEAVLDPANRADPYPLYAALRESPVQELEDGTYLVTGYPEVLQVVHDPRFSSDPKNLSSPGVGHGGHQHDDEDGSDEASGGPAPGLGSAFVMLDPPEHDRLRSLTTRQFGPPHKPGYIDGMRADLVRIVDSLIDRLAGREEIDLVADLAYPLPVMVICDVLGVPPEDEPRFHAWTKAIIAPPEATDAEDRVRKDAESAAATAEMARYLAALADERRGAPRDDLISGLVNDDGPHGRMSQAELLSTTIMLLIGGHETTVNMIANGALTLLRDGRTIDRLQHEPELMARVFEELLRLEPPAQITPTRVALSDVTIGATTIRKGSPVWMVWAAANRDPRQFSDPDRFNPDRDRLDHVGFGGGIHSCFGAPLARLETQIALSALFSRLVAPRLVTDPPPYRHNAFLRGPSELRIRIDGVRPAAS